MHAPAALSLGWCLVLNRGGEFQPVWPDRSGLLVPGDASSLTVTDLNGDGLADFHVGINDGQPLAFTATGAGQKPGLCLQLRGGETNPDAIGARVTLVHKDGRRQVQQVSAGGGYLSQSSPRLFFGTGDAGISGIDHIEVAWPDGETSEHQAGELGERPGRHWIGKP